MNFNKRFNIQIDEKELHKRFLNRFENFIVPFISNINSPYKFKETVTRIVATKMGINYSDYHYIGSYPFGNFYRCLQLLEFVHECFDQKFGSNHEFGKQIQILLNLDEGSGIEWRNGKFYPKGAKLLDKKLVNDTLDWLRDKNISSVSEPFEKGLNHFLKSKVDAGLLKDVITEMYESLEAMARIVVSKPRAELSKIQEKYIKELKVSSGLKNILKEYISYSNQFRHAVGPNAKREIPKEYEVESFIYLTGVFIRLSKRSLDSISQPN